MFTEAYQCNHGASSAGQQGQGLDSGLFGPISALSNYRDSAHGKTSSETTSIPTTNTMTNSKYSFATSRHGSCFKAASFQNIGSPVNDRNTHDYRGERWNITISDSRFSTSRIYFLFRERQQPRQHPANTDRQHRQPNNRVRHRLVATFGLH